MHPTLKIAPKIALIKNTLDGENRSAIVNKANTKVPAIKPNCTAEVKFPKALSCKLKVVTRLFITPFPANHKEVQQNCEKTIMGNMCFGIFILFDEITKNNLIIIKKIILQQHYFLYI